MSNTATLPRTEVIEGHTFQVSLGWKRATSLTHDDVLADGVHIVRTSHQLEWFYITGVRRNPKPGCTPFVERRYRHDQMVRVEDWKLI